MLQRAPSMKVALVCEIRVPNEGLEGGARRWGAPVMQEGQLEQVGRIQHPGIRRARIGRPVGPDESHAPDRAQPTLPCCLRFPRVPVRRVSQWCLEQQGTPVRTAPSFAGSGWGEYILSEKGSQQIDISYNTCLYGRFVSGIR